MTAVLVVGRRCLFAAIFLLENVLILYQLLWRKFVLNFQWLSLFVCLYPPPNQESDMFLDNLSRLHDLLSKEKAKIITMGDFNCDVLARRKSKLTNELLNSVLMNGFSQLMREFTRATESSKTAIDLTFVNTSERIVASGTIAIGISDHFGIFVVRKLVY